MKTHLYIIALMASLLMVFSRERVSVQPGILRTIAPKRIIRSVKQKSRDILLRLRELGPATLMELLTDEGAGTMVMKG